MQLSAVVFVQTDVKCLFAIKTGTGINGGEQRQAKKAEPSRRMASPTESGLVNTPPGVILLFMQDKANGWLFATLLLDQFLANAFLIILWSDTCSKVSG